MILFDTHMILVILGTAVLGGVLGLDRTAVGQFMVSQPIVAGPLTGWFLGDLNAGVVIGSILELIWVLDMPIGSFVPANSTISAVSATAIAALGGQGSAQLPVIGFSLLLTTGMVPVTMTAEHIVRTWNSRLARPERSSPGSSSRRFLAREHVSGLMAFYFQSFALCLVFVPLGIIALVLFKQLPEIFLRAMSFFVGLLPLLGAAVMVRSLSMKIIDVFVLAGFAIAAILGQVFHAHALIILLVIILGGWLGARYRDVRG